MDIESLICPSCNSRSFRLRFSGNQTEAFCDDCGTSIRHVCVRPYEELNFGRGKWKHEKISACQNLRYLVRASRKPTRKFTRARRLAIKRRIVELNPDHPVPFGPLEGVPVQQLPDEVLDELLRVIPPEGDWYRRLLEN